MIAKDVVSGNTIWMQRRPGQRQQMPDQPIACAAFNPDCGAAMIKLRQGRESPMCSGGLSVSDPPSMDNGRMAAADDYVNPHRHLISDGPQTNLLVGAIEFADQ